MCCGGRAQQIAKTLEVVYTASFLRTGNEAVFWHCSARFRFANVDNTRLVIVFLFFFLTRIVILSLSIMRVYSYMYMFEVRVPHHILTTLTQPWQ